MSLGVAPRRHDEVATESLLLELSPGDSGESLGGSGVLLLSFQPEDALGLQVVVVMSPGRFSSETYTHQAHPSRM